LAPRREYDVRGGDAARCQIALTTCSTNCRKATCVSFTIPGVWSSNRCSHSTINVDPVLRSTSLEQRKRSAPPLHVCRPTCAVLCRMHRGQWDVSGHLPPQDMCPWLANSIAERTVPELILVLGSQAAGDVSQKPGGRLPLLSARPAVTPATLKRAATSFAAR